MLNLVSASLTIKGMFVHIVHTITHRLLFEKLYSLYICIYQHLWLSWLRFQKAVLYGGTQAVEHRFELRPDH